MIPAHKNRTDPIVTSAFQDLLHISPDIFQEFDLDDLVSKKPVLAKEKGVLNRKKTPRSILLIGKGWYEIS